jgi:hypothetical protein
MSIYIPHLDQWIAHFQWYILFWTVWTTNLLMWIEDEF